MGYDYDDDEELGRVDVDQRAWRKAFEEEQSEGEVNKSRAAGESRPKSFRDEAGEVRPRSYRDGDVEPRTRQTARGNAGEERLRSYHDEVVESRARRTTRASAGEERPRSSAAGGVGARQTASTRSEGPGASRSYRDRAGTARTNPMPQSDAGRTRTGRTDADNLNAASRTTTRSVARQKKTEKNNRKKRIIITIIAEIFALLFIFIYAYAYKLYSKPQRLQFEPKNIQNQELSVADIKKMKGYWMIAIFGVDSRGSNVGKGTNADVNMIACINQDTGDIKLVSVYRDSYLNIDDQGTYNKINAAYSSGGPEQAVKALNKNLDLNITDYITFNWKGVADAINILGGVDVEITKSEFKYINSFITETVKSTGIGSHQLKSAGMNHLDGVQAVAYGRLRLMDTDYARTERQRKIIELAFAKAKVADYSVLNNILVVVLPQVATSLSFADLTNVALNITKYKLGETGGFPFTKGDANMGKRGACVIPKTLESNVIELHKFLFGDETYTTTETVKKISAKIASDTGMYSQMKAQNSTKASTDENSKENTKESTSEKESSTTFETDEYGHPVIPGIPETDENGNAILGTTANESLPVHPGSSESSGATNPSRPTGPVNPTETSGNNGPTDNIRPTDSTNPGKPTETMPAETKPGGTESGGGPGETNTTKPESSLPHGPLDTEPETTSSVRPGGTETSTAATPGGTPGDVIGNNGPGE